MNIELIFWIIFTKSREYQKKFNGNFQMVLQECLNNYLSLIESSEKVEDDIEVIRNLCEKIQHIVNVYLSGKPGVAYRLLDSLLLELKNNLFFYKIDSQDVYYRMRVCDLRRNLRRKDLFHIPFSQIRNITTQRYSVPGFPCLYLGRSIYGCWEEMHRPAIESTLISAFKPKREIHLLDLRIPSKKNFVENKSLYLRLIPLIIACTIPVSQKNSPFKPEYIIPQLILQWIIENGVSLKEDCLGIIYSSAFSNIDFFELDFEWDNIVLPVQIINTESDYCPVLHFSFENTEPTCYEYEVLKGNLMNTGIWDNGPDRIKNGDKGKEKYYYSVFSRMEELLNTFEFDDIDMPPWQI